MTSGQIWYAPEHDSTKGISDHLSTRLAERWHEVDERDLYFVAEAHPEPGHPLVIGGAVHNGAWLPVAETFVRNNADCMRTLPLWMFSVGMDEALRGPLRLLAARADQPGIVRLVDLVRPRDHRRFSGVIRRKHLDRTGAVLFRLLGCRYGDYRNWTEVDDWAAGISRGLKGLSGGRSSFHWRSSHSPVTVDGQGLL